MILTMFVTILIILVIILAHGKLHPINACKKRPDLECPYKVTVTVNGSFHTEGHNKCCSSVDNYIKMNDAFCSMQPNKNYNGMTITPEFKQSCLNKQQRYKNINTEGPLE